MPLIAEHVDPLAVPTIVGSLILLAVEVLSPPFPGTGGTMKMTVYTWEVLAMAVSPVCACHLAGGRGDRIREVAR